MSTTLKYRPDLDGIRALAVLAVIIFHIDAAWLPGGFLGVDMFFVLSGYLITTIISREMQNGSFSFLEFYKRRAKRILPVFSCVLLCTSLAAAIFFLSFDLRQYVKSAVFALLFSANLFFARRGGYFDADAAEKPLQHIWSLSLEEQFYFVFPVLLTAFFRFSKGRNIRQFILLLIVLSLLSVFLPTFGMDPYFLPYVRAYELLIGALFAFIPPSQTNDRFSTPVVGWAMMAVIAAMLLLPYGVLPGEGNIERLLCCTAVGGLIYSGKTLQTQNGFNTAKLLSLKPVVFIGLISYSLYLWHWPVLAFMRYIGSNNLPSYSTAAAIVLMFALSLLSYYFVEKPFKKWKGSFAQSVAWIYAVPMLVLAITPFLAMKLPFMEQYDRMGLARSYTSCHNNTDKQCVWGDTDKQPELLILGDSHADQYKNVFLIPSAKKKNGRQRWSRRTVVPM